MMYVHTVHGCSGAYKYSLLFSTEVAGLISKGYAAHCEFLVVGVEVYLVHRDTKVNKLN